MINQCGPSDPVISGLAWNSAFNMLWMSTNSETDNVYGLNPDTCQTVKTLAAPDNMPWTGAGLETDTAGNLWMVSQGMPSTAYLVDSGVPNFTDVPWLQVTPGSGTLTPGASERLTVEVDTTGFAPGVYGATVVVVNNGGREKASVLPIRVIVPAYQTAINTGGAIHRDGSGDSWVTDQAYRAGGYGYLDNNRSKVARTTTPIAGTSEQPLYQNLREGAYEYRFDNVPNGVYAIDLAFAELRRIRPNTRLFDVISEDTLLVPALDIAGEAGSFAAVNRTVYVTVTDGQLNLRLISRRGEPIINALRVTHRPDRSG